MDNQEIFTKVVSHLRKQGCRSYENSITNCFYRGENGTKCAIGCLIEDDEYCLSFEGKSAKSLLTCNLTYEFNFNSYEIKRLEKFRSRFIDLDNEFIGALQAIHDLNLPEDWEKCFATVARDFDLDLPEKVLNG